MRILTWFIHYKEQIKEYVVEILVTSYLNTLNINMHCTSYV